MCVEKRRGCGFRKVGGTYLVGGGIGIPCDRLPFELTVCPCCSGGIKQARGWTWIDVAKLFQGPHLVDARTALGIAAGVPFETFALPCACKKFCPLCRNPESMGRAGLIWIGEKFYKTPAQFVKEGIELGFSRRIKAVPQGFKVGETWVLLAHSLAVSTPFSKDNDEYKPGVFYAWLPQRIELLMNESQRNSEEVEAAEKRGITVVFVPDSDPDHHGNVHDDLDREKKKGEDE